MAGGGGMSITGGSMNSAFGSTANSENGMDNSSGGGMAAVGMMLQAAPPKASNGLFGVFDGHGGIEVAEFVSRHFEEILLNSAHYKAMNYEAALQETFLKMDEMLLSVEGKQEIVEINKQNPANISQLERALVASGSLKGKVKYVTKKVDQILRTAHPKK